jgi:hypothetical protein
MAKKAQPANGGRDWPFSDPKSLASITLKRIVSGERPVLVVTHDDDGSWQFLDGEAVSNEDASVVGLGTMIELDPTLVQVAALPWGWVAVRERVGGAWNVQPARE